jgi:hypothetical protein
MITVPVVAIAWAFGQSAGVGVARFRSVEIALPVSTKGNPYDPDLNDVRVVFKGSRAETHERLAYYRDNKWRVRANLPKSGKYTASVKINGRIITGADFATDLTAPVSGFVTTKGRQFMLDGSKPFWPIGFNVAWRPQKNQPVSSFFPKMSKTGLNWTRVWACHWDDRNPFWLANFPKVQGEEMSEEAFRAWDEIIQQAEQNQIKFQFVLFHHGAFSTDVNPNWKEHPWNTDNGGFLSSASDFFTHPIAKLRTKMFLRYVVARYGHSPSIMAWELFNEVQFVERIRKFKDWKVVSEWHREMARYLKSLDADRHLVTTSSELEQPLWDEMDYLQGHGYPMSVEGMLRGTPLNKKPLFFGEIGPGGSGTDTEHRFSIRDGLWTALLNEHSGAGQYWFWDRMTRPGMYREYETSMPILRSLGSLGDFRKQSVRVSVPNGADLVLVPGKGWEATRKTSFKVPSEDLSEVASYFQGKAHPEMQGKPIQLNFVTQAPTKLILRVAGVSDPGATAIIRVNGIEKWRRDWPAKAKDRQATATISLDTPGPQMVEFDNIGEDWYQVSSITVQGIAPLARVAAARADRRLVARIRADREGVAFNLESLGLKSGDYELQMTDLETRLVSSRSLRVDGRPVSLKTLGKDQIVTILPR